MLAMAFNVAKTFPPAIIYLDEAEQIFKGKKKIEMFIGKN